MKKQLFVLEVPITEYQVPGTSCHVPPTRDQAAGTGNQVPGTSTRHQVPFVAYCLLVAY